jgi:dipeptidyl-peptidase 4
LPDYFWRSLSIMRFSSIAVLLLWAATASAQSKLITLEDLWRDGTFSSKSVPGFNALPDGEHYTDLSNEGGKQSIRIKNLRDGKESGILYNGSLNVDEYIISDKRDRLLLLTEGQNIYRRSVLHKAYIYDVASGREALLDMEKVLHPTFSPDGSKVAFVKDNNLYYTDLSDGHTVQITKDGERNKVINGNCDWVYEEEFEFTRAYEWSPNGESIAFYRFDERNVPEYTMTVYDNLYPTPYQYKYPKAGEDNSTVQIRIYDLSDKTTVRADVAAGEHPQDYYVPRIKWTKDPSKLLVYKMNRRQNKLSLLLTDVESGNSKSIYDETNKSYIEINDNMHFLKDGYSMVFTSERNGWNQVYLANWRNSKDNGLWALSPKGIDVDALVGVDDAAGIAYYTMADRNGLERKLYATSLYDKKSTRCLTPQSGVHAITPIEGNRYFLDRFSMLNTPPVYQLLDAQGRVVRTLEDNAKLKVKMSEYKLGKMELIEVEGAGGAKLNAWRILPPDFDPKKKYPVLMYQYSGPGSQEVADRFPIRDYFWHHMLAQKGYIIVCADGRGTGFRGEAFKKKTYLQLGKYESDDQIAVAKYLGTLPYVDKSRIGIWGWSYGGFMSSTCIMKGADVFKTAVAVAPVTNWRYYDNIYTERYMRKPSENKEGYDANAPETMASKLKGKFLLIHGTGDDNVHFQNSVMLVNNLIKEGKEFDSEYYPNKAHGISGGSTRLHLYGRMTKFILENL